MRDGFENVDDIYVNRPAEDNASAKEASQGTGGGVEESSDNAGASLVRSTSVDEEAVVPDNQP